MNEMIERAAIAIASNGTRRDWWPKLNEIIRNACRVQARAAIDAIHEPTDTMLIAAREWSREKYGRPIGNDAATGCYKVMIDAAMLQT